MTEHPPSSRIWHVPCNFTFNGCRVRAEALARRLHLNLWPSGSPYGGLDAGSAAAGVNGFGYDSPPSENDDDDLRPIVEQTTQNKTRLYGASCWENPTANMMLGSSEDDEYYDPQAGSSPPSPAVDDIVVNPPVAMPVLYRSALDGDEDATTRRTVREQPRRQHSFRRSDAVDIKGLYEKLQRYADSKSLSDADSDTYYDVDSGGSSPEEASGCDSVDGEAGCRRAGFAESSSEREDCAGFLKYNGLPRSGDCAPHTHTNAKYDVNGHCGLQSPDRTKSNDKVHRGVPNGEISVLADFLYGECRLSSSPTKSQVSPPETSRPSKEPQVLSDDDVPELVSPNHLDTQDEHLHEEETSNREEVQESSKTNHEDADIETCHVKANGHHDEPSTCHDEMSTTSHVQDEPADCQPQINGAVPEVRDESISAVEQTTVNGESAPQVSAETEQTLCPAPAKGSSEEGDSRSPVRRTFIRSTSLKTGKTPPGTPHRKKIVRFADALGLDLELVRTIVSDDVPHVPPSAYTDLELPDNEKPDTSPDSRRGSATMHIRPAWQVPLQGLTPFQRRTLTPEFAQPVAEFNFLDRVRSQSVCLENIVVTDMSINGVVRVLNISYEKAVLIRYTVNEWTTSDEVAAKYVQGSCDGFSDKFTFTIHVPFLSPGQRIVFAVRFVTNGQEYWDNNFGINYVVRCNSESSQYLNSPSDGPIWLHHFV